MTEQQKPRRAPAWPRWRAVAAAAVAGVAGTAALIALREPEPPAPRLVATLEDGVPVKAPADPLMGELLRCRSIPAGSDDVSCREAWEVNRRRFSGESRTYAPPTALGADQGR